MTTALIVEDDARSLDSLATLVGELGYEVVKADTYAAAEERLGEDIDVMISDLVLPDGTGRDLLPLAEELGVTTVVVTGEASVDSAVEALRHGALDYIRKPIDVERLKLVLQRVLETVRLRGQVATLRRHLRDLGRFGDLIGTCDRMQTVYDLLERVSATAATVLVVGESGTGKELVARTIHDLSRRSEADFVAVNCSAMAGGLLESELFGHEKGSFTGASRRHRGLFEQADGGTLLLDEITEMPVDLQAKLLRVLETGTYRRVGGESEHAMDVRIVAATNRDPLEAVEAGKLRRDLFYRLNVFPIVLPPLRSREGDVRLLAGAFLEKLNADAKTGKKLSGKALELLEGYHWPGNVRELKNAIERAFIISSDVLETTSFPDEITGRREPEGPDLHVRVGSSIEEVERRLLLATLHHFEGNRTRTAATLGVSVKTLYNRLRAYEAEAEEEKETEEE